ncbi:hypothetical protein B0H11DRAFT_2263087 [Mycena galericulata]|nr:hypothetical protein B0H11DRAFT_2263087 [Mycena galericulata]
MAGVLSFKEDTIAKKSFDLIGELQNLNDSDRWALNVDVPPPFPPFFTTLKRDTPRRRRRSVSACLSPCTRIVDMKDLTMALSSTLWRSCTQSTTAWHCHVLSPTQPVSTSGAAQPYSDISLSSQGPPNSFYNYNRRIGIHLLSEKDTSISDSSVDSVLSVGNKMFDTAVNCGMPLCAISPLESCSDLHNRASFVSIIDKDAPGVRVRAEKRKHATYPEEDQPDKVRIVTEASIRSTTFGSKPDLKTV